MDPMTVLIEHDLPRSAAQRDLACRHLQGVSTCTPCAPTCAASTRWPTSWRRRCAGRPDRCGTPRRDGGSATQCAVTLHTTTYGEEGSLIVFCHGLFGQGRNWTGIAKALAGEHRTVLVDLPHHGRSAWSESFDYVEVADEVADAARGPSARTTR